MANVLLEDVQLERRFEFATVELSQQLLLDQADLEFLKFAALRVQTVILRPQRHLPAKTQALSKTYDATILESFLAELPS